MAQRIALFTAVLCAALHVGTAQADWQLERAQDIAAKVWNDPCGGTLKGRNRARYYAAIPKRLSARSEGHRRYRVIAALLCDG